MMDDMELLSKVFPDNKLSRAVFKISELETDNDGAWKALDDFGGEGWVCHTGSPDILVYPSKTQLSDETGRGWILFAEAVNGPRSLHIDRNGDRWMLSYFSKDDAGDKNGIITDDILTGKVVSALRYETEWQPVISGTSGRLTTELRPVACRFAGFIK